MKGLILVTYRRGRSGDVWEFGEERPARLIEFWMSG